MAMAAVGAAEAAAAAGRIRSPLDNATRLIADQSPAKVIETIVALAGTADKPLGRSMALSALAGVSCTAVSRGRTPAMAALSGGAGLGMWAARRRPPREPASAQLGTIGAGLVAGSAAMLAPGPAAATLGLAGLTGLLQAHRQRGREASRASQATFAELLDASSPLPPAVDGAAGWSGVMPFHTPLPQVYITDVNSRPLIVDRDAWRLRIDGLVARELALSDGELRDLGVIEQDVLLVCIHSRPGWHRLASLRVQGVPVRRVVEAAGPTAGAVDLGSTAVDGFTMRHPVDLALAEGLIVLGWGGRRLSPEHGGPARLFVPGLYGQYAGVKWLERLTLNPTRADFYWESRGWPAGLQWIRPLSRIDAVGGARLPVGDDMRDQRGPLRVPAARGVSIVGTAWAPADGGVDAVQIQLDDGPWLDAELADVVAERSWRRWHLVTDLPAGHHRLAVRCRTATGRWQDPEPTQPYPTGATGLHRVSVVAHTATSRLSPLRPTAPMSTPEAAAPGPGRVVRVGVTQMHAAVGDVDARLAQAEQLVKDCVSAGATWVVLPEFFSTGVADTDAVRAGVSAPDGAPVRLLSDLSAQHGIWLTASLLIGEGNRVRNAQLVHDPQGRLCARHDKDLPTMWENGLYEGADPGDDGVAAVDGIATGLTMCWELTRSRTVRRLAGRVDVVLAGSGWWSVPEWPPRQLTRRLAAANVRRAHASPGVFAQHVGAPVVHSAHVGAFASAGPGMPGRYTGRYVGGTGVWSATGDIVAFVDPDRGATTEVTDLHMGHVAPTRRTSGFWLTEPGLVPRYVWTVQRTIGRRDYRNRQTQASNLSAG